jgi:hypothetical protein
MMNKKNLLGRTPTALGMKDALHVAVVSLRAAYNLSVGSRISLNEHGEAVCNGDEKDTFGIVNPYRKTDVVRGEWFWCMMDFGDIPKVKHVWDHPTVSFEPPTREVELNETLNSYAKDLGITYQQLMDITAKVVDSWEAQPYPKDGTKTEEEVDAVEMWDFWYEWQEETDYEFENQGSACCPEYDYPGQLFEFE